MPAPVKDGLSHGVSNTRGADKHVNYVSTAWAASIYMFLYMLYVVFVASVDYTTWISVLLGVQDEPGLAKWRALSPVAERVTFSPRNPSLLVLKH